MCVNKLLITREGNYVVQFSNGTVLTKHDIDSLLPMLADRLA